MATIPEAVNTAAYKPWTEAPTGHLIKLPLVPEYTRLEEA